MDQSQRPDTGTGERTAPGRLELSVPQVAGSALAAVAAAVFASKLGVYGTIIGAGVVSVIATSGGPLFQHLFRRTGDQLREVTVQVKPRARQVYDSEPPSPAAGVPVPDPHPHPSAHPDPSAHAQEPSARGEFGGATTYGTRIRGRKRSVVAAVVVFTVAMLAITGYELAAGQDLSGGKGTTFSSVVRGGDTGRDSPPDRPAGPKDGGTTPSDDGTDPGTDTGPGTGPTDTPTPTPSVPGGGQSPDAPESPDTPETGGPSTVPSPGTSQPDGGTAGSGHPEGGTAPPPPAVAPSG